MSQIETARQQLLAPRRIAPRPSWSRPGCTDPGRPRPRDPAPPPSAIACVSSAVDSAGRPHSIRTLDFVVIVLTRSRPRRNPSASGSATSAQPQRELSVAGQECDARPGRGHLDERLVLGPVVERLVGSGEPTSRLVHAPGLHQRHGHAALDARRIAAQVRLLQYADGSLEQREGVLQLAAGRSRASGLIQQPPARAPAPAASSAACSK